MPKNYNIDYQNARGAELTKDKVDDPKASKELLDSLAAKVDKALEDILEPPKDGKYHNKYDRVFTDGESVSSIVKSNTTAEMMNSGVDEDYYGAAFVAMAQMGGKELKVLPFSEPIDAEPQPLTASGTLLVKDLSLWERFFSMFGFYQDRVAEVEERKNRVQVEKYAEKVQQFIDKESKQKSDIESQYLKDVDVDLLDKGKVEGLAEGKPRTLWCFPEGEKNYNSRSCYNVLSCMMMARGHSLKDICDPNYNDSGDRAKVGKELAVLVNEIRSEDKDVSHKAQKKYADILVQGGKDFLAQPFPDKAQWENMLDTPNPNYVIMLSGLGHDLFQEFSRGRNKTEFILTDPENHMLQNKLTAASSLAGSVSACHALVHGKKEFSPDHIDFMETTSIHKANHKIGIGLTNFKGDNIGEVVLNNEDNYAQLKTIQSAAIETGCCVNDLRGYGMSFQDIDNGNVDLVEYYKSTDSYKDDYASMAEAMKKGGIFTVTQAKWDLARDCTDKLMNVPGSNEENDLTQSVKNKMTVKIFEDEKFKELTDNKSVDEVNAFYHKPEFLQDISQGLLKSDSKSKLIGSTLEKIQSIAPRAVTENQYRTDYSNIHDGRKFRELVAGKNSDQILALIGSNEALECVVQDSCFVAENYKKQKEQEKVQEREQHVSEKIDKGPSLS